jgi:hypothetical protein
MREELALQSAQDLTEPREQVEMGLENDSRSHAIKIVDSRWVNACQNLGEEIGFFWLSPSRQTRSPGRMTASRSACVLSGSTTLPVA